ncbi:MAG: hypothetical protein AB7S70_06855 [Hyphomicrobium sp.]|uniref:hypothetical protein n=1 Tax=Hyphomicrobium sp. TaxID=82 RepID=UPI003D0FFC9E
MRSRTLCFLVLGASLSVIASRLAQRRLAPARRPVSRGGPAEVIDLAAWRAKRERAAVLATR